MESIHLLQPYIFIRKHWKHKLNRFIDICMNIFMLCKLRLKDAGLWIDQTVSPLLSPLLKPFPVPHLTKEKTLTLKCRFWSFIFFPGSSYPVWLLCTLVFEACEACYSSTSNYSHRNSHEAEFMPQKQQQRLNFSRWWHIYCRSIVLYWYQ